MRIIWDEPKRLANIDKHGFDFAGLTLTFFDEAAVRPAKKGRFQAVGPFASDLISVIFASLGSEAL